MSSQPGPDQSEGLEAQAEAVYWEAVQDCLAGRQAATAAKLRALGCHYALAPAVWAAARGQRPAAVGPDATSPAAATAAPAPISLPGGACCWAADAVLPAALLARLQAAFAPDARFWEQHRYDDPATPFFSYVAPLHLGGGLEGAGDGGGAAGGRAEGGSGAANRDGGGGGGGGTAAPQTILEAAAALLWRHACVAAAAAGGVGPAGLLRDATHVEFWAHTRGLDAPHQLHFDVNEGLLRRGRAAYRLVHPAASSLLFLTGAGGPTIVLHQSPAGALGQEGAPDEPGRAPPAKRRRVGGGGSGCLRHEMAEEGQQQQQEEEEEQQQQPSEGEHERRLWAPLGEDAARHLADRAWLLRPSPGRWAVWPGCLLHGVLPVALEQECGDEGGDASPCSPAQGQDASAPVAQRRRTTLILAWWRGDPRAALSAAPEKRAGGEDGEEEGVALDRPPPWPRPLMPLPAGACEARGTAAGGSVGCDGASVAAAAAAEAVAAGGSWVEDLLLREGEWDALLAASGGGGTAGGGGGEAGGGGDTAGGAPQQAQLPAPAPIDEVSPCWVAVAPLVADDTAAATAAGGARPVSGGGGGGGDSPARGANGGSGLAMARLPPLRFFLPSVDAIEAAYPQRA